MNDDDDLVQQGHAVTAAQAKKLEAKLLEDASDYKSRLKLLGYYETFDRRVKVETKVIDHLLWLIEHRPQSTGFKHYIFVGTKDSISSLEKAWLKAISNHKNDLAVLNNAAEFCVVHSPELAIHFWKKALKLDPKNESATRKLSEVYLSLAHDPKKLEDRKCAVNALKFGKMALQIHDGSDENTYLEQLMYSMVQGLSDLALRFCLLKQAKLLANYLQSREILVKSAYRNTERTRQAELRLANEILKNVEEIENSIADGKGLANKEQIPDGSDSDVNLIFAGEMLTALECRKLKTRLKVNPSDLAARLQLLGYYSKNLNSRRQLQQRFELALWMIKNRPGDHLTGYVTYYANSRQWSLSMKQQTTDLWKAQAKSHPHQAQVLFNAAIHIGGAHGNRLLLKAKTADPKFALASRWLAQHYRRKTKTGTLASKKKFAALALDELDCTLKLKDHLGERTGMLIEFTPVAIAFGHLARARTYAQKLRRHGKEMEFWAHYALTYLILIDLLENKYSSAHRQIRLLKASYQKEPSHVATGTASKRVISVALEFGHQDLAQGFLEALIAGTTKDSEVRKLKRWSKQISKGIQPNFDLE